MSVSPAPTAFAFTPVSALLGSSTSTSCQLSRVRSKRAFDITCALLLLIVLAPVLLFIAAAVLIDSGWPVLFRQERVGARPVLTPSGVRWELSRFRILKFRSMANGSHESRLHEEFVAAFVGGSVANSDGVNKLVRDPRITRFGRFLRRSSLDELPQLVNVLRGEMSLVGPRPVPVYEAAAYDAAARERLAGRPGITGPWQVKARARASFDEMVALDVEYLRSSSLATDMKFLVLTVPAVISGSGAR